MYVLGGALKNKLKLVCMASVISFILSGCSGGAAGVSMSSNNSEDNSLSGIRYVNDDEFPIVQTSNGISKIPIIGHEEEFITAITTPGEPESYAAGEVGSTSD